MTTIVIILIVILVLLTGVAVWQQQHKEPTEAFFARSMATLPEPTQVSSISRDVAKATTANPDLAKPDMRDWADARDSLQLFLDAYGMAASQGRLHESDANPKAVAQMLRIAPLALQDVEYFIAKPESLPDRGILDVAERAKLLANMLRRPGDMKPVAENTRQQAAVNAA